MLCSLLAYDIDGSVVATLDHMVARDAEGRVAGLIDFDAHEAAGGSHVDIWVVDSGDPAHPVKGSKVWPEWLGSRAHDFRVELVGPPGAKHIAALVHKTSGHRRERAALEAAVAARIAAANGAPADIRDIVGGPDRPLVLDAEGKTVGRSTAGGTPAHLPLVGTT